MLMIKGGDIDEFLKDLSKKVTVVDVRKNILPIKQYFLPAIEEIFVASKNKILPRKKTSPFVLFGINSRESEALIQLDEIMRKPNEDFFYFERRASATIVSLVEEDGPIYHTGIDLILEKINEKYYKTHILTSKGKKIAFKKFFKEKKSAFKSEKNPSEETMPELRQALLDPEALKDAVEWSWKGYPEIWEELGKQCLGCGICTYVCPLCYCFSMEDRCHLDGKKCSKTRKWTACTLPEFAKITGGHDFHPTIKERYYNWFYHKFVRAYKEYGKSQCVACGKCQKYCPARIDIEEVLMEILKKYNG